MECVMCGRTHDDIYAAIEAGWMPSYFDGDEEMEGPVCGECVDRKLIQARDGELELRYPEVRLNVRPIERKRMAHCPR